MLSSMHFHYIYYFSKMLDCVGCLCPTSLVIFLGIVRVVCFMVSLDSELDLFRTLENDSLFCQDGELNNYSNL